ncbi:aldo/keto reductase [Ignisphaera sp. 4213-co]|uniref:Aldo/keto reductase n=1 Tax=Ignisphaera cupida TaxID=3050454 RepID=A0ABD4Z4R0_9CREN|nr:aldo/keto reductase [Ignisphaera sp. 4213-co]MDK6028296.1 aldo/keto reductase [Ignisphaera sp. 4213-co]
MVENNVSKYRKVLGKTGEKISPLGFGTHNIRDFINAEKALLKTIEYGINVFEISETYANGLVIEFFGRFLTKIKRDEVFIVFRVSPLILANPNTAEIKFKNILQKMNISHVDVIMLGWYEDAIPLDFQLRSLERIVDSGYARYIGVSGLKLKQLSNALNIMKKHEIAMIQNKYNVLDKRIEKDLIPFAIKNNITIQACSALEKGHALKHPVVIHIASKYGKTPAQVALSYIFSKPNVVALIKSENIDHVIEDIMSLNLVLSEEDLNALKSI